MEKRQISFSPPDITEAEVSAVADVLRSDWITTGPRTKEFEKRIAKLCGTNKAVALGSATACLESILRFLGIGAGDEVITSAYTYTASASPAVHVGATLKFIDVAPDSFEMDYEALEAAITEKTKAIVPVHYAGVSCDMDKIMEIAKRHNLIVIEDAAQGIMSTYHGKALGTIGDYGCYSFHETKNYSMGEGGAILIKDKDKAEEAEILREKGTNRSKFFRGQIDKYTWVNYGSSYLPSDMNAAYLYAQLLQADMINNYRLNIWNTYYDGFGELEKSGKIELPYIPEGCTHNAHMFYIKAKDLQERTALISFLKENGIQAVFHYIPLHSAPAGKKFGRFNGEDKYTTRESERLMRLPMYYGLKDEEVQYIISKVKEFYK